MVDDDSPVGINRRRDAGVGVAQQPAVVFDRAHAGLFQVLGVSPAVSVPAVVGDIHKDLRAVGGQLPDLIGKDRFIADEHPELVLSGLQRRPRSSGREIANLLGQSAGKAEHTLEGHIFAERNQMHLVVAPTHSPPG